MTLQQLPLEVLAHIASKLPIVDAGELAKTCHVCYFAVLPYLWYHLSLHNTTELELIANRLKKNQLWAEKAIRFVRDISLSSNPSDHIIYPPTVAASLFGITVSPSEQALEESQKAIVGHERIGRFGSRLLEIFPHLSNLVFDFTEAVKNFCKEQPNSNETEETINQRTMNENDLDVFTDLSPEQNEILSPITDNSTISDDIKLQYTGSISLVNYKPDHTQFMHYLLFPFRESCQLTLQASPIISLCDDIDSSILTNKDIHILSTIGLVNLRKLELSYLDSNVTLDTLKELIESLPCITELDLQWIFPPTKQEFNQLCKVFEDCGSLQPKKICTSKCNVLHAHFIRIVYNDS